MVNATLVVGGIIVAILAAIGALVTTVIVSAANLQSNALFALLPTLFGVAAVMGLLFAAFGAFLR